MPQPPSSFQKTMRIRLLGLSALLVWFAVTSTWADRDEERDARRALSLNENFNDEKVEKQGRTTTGAIPEKCFCDEDSMSVRIPVRATGTGTGEVNGNTWICRKQLSRSSCTCGCEGINKEGSFEATAAANEELEKGACKSEQHEGSDGHEIVGYCHIVQGIESGVDYTDGSG